MLYVSKFSNFDVLIATTAGGDYIFRIMCHVAVFSRLQYIQKAKTLGSTSIRHRSIDVDPMVFAIRVGKRASCIWYGVRESRWPGAKIRNKGLKQGSHLWPAVFNSYTRKLPQTCVYLISTVDINQILIYVQLNQCQTDVDINILSKLKSPSKLDWNPVVSMDSLNNEWFKFLNIHIERSVYVMVWCMKVLLNSGIILGMSSVNERRRYTVTSSLIGWAPTQNDIC